MKWIFLIVIAGLIVIAVKLYPLVQNEKACFDTAGQAIEDINYNVSARNWSKETVCSRRTDTLLDLEDCIKAATGGSKLAVYTNKYIEDAVYFVRPLTKSLTTLKNEHNEDCADYETYQLP